MRYKASGNWHKLEPSASRVIRPEPFPSNSCNPGISVAVATFFDFNGVLVDDEAVHLEAFRDALRPLGIQVSHDDYFERYIGFDDVGAFRAILSDAALDADEARVRALVAAKKPLYLQRAQAELRTFDGAASLVRRRAATGPVAVVSGALRDEIEFGLDALGVRDAVGFIVAAEDTSDCKPHPEGYLIALERLGARADRAVVIEDSVAGVQAAKAAGLVCLAVEHSAPARELLAAGADRVRAALADLKDEDFDLASALPR